MDADDANRHPVINDFGLALAWSPDGSYLAYSTTCDSKSEVWVADTACSRVVAAGRRCLRPGLVTRI